MSQQQRLEKERADFAWKCIADIKNISDEKKRKEYGSLARSAPADIQTNGLGQSVAFWRAKAKGDTSSAHGQLLSHVENWLAKPEQLNLTNTSVSQWITTMAKTGDYLRATTETISLLVWIKRFAEAELSD